MFHSFLNEFNTKSHGSISFPRGLGINADKIHLFGEVDRTQNLVLGCVYRTYWAPGENWGIHTTESEQGPREPQQTEFFTENPSPTASLPVATNLVPWQFQMLSWQ